MNTVGVIALASAHGIKLTPDGDRIRVKPASKLTPELKDAIRSCRDDLLKVLTHDGRTARIDQIAEPNRRRADGRGRSTHDRNAKARVRTRAAGATTGVQAGAHASPTEQLTDPTKPCPTCGSGQYWQLPNEPWHCWRCEPNKPLTATTLTLTCHPTPAPPTGAQNYSDAVLEVVCKNLNITPAQLREELSDDDLSELSPKALRQVARTLADARPPQNEAIDMLRQDPELECAFVTTSDDQNYVYVVVAIRGQATGRLRIPRDKYDGLKALELIEQHASKP
jgi:hypothetical protein